MPKHILDPAEAIFLPEEEVAEMLGRERTETVEGGVTIVRVGLLNFEVERGPASGTFEIAISISAIVGEHQIASFQLDPQTPSRNVRWSIPYANANLTVTLEAEKKELSFGGFGCLRATDWLCQNYGEVLLRW